MTIDEILDAMPDEDTSTGRDYLVIDPLTRTITVPESEKVFGVTGDEVADRKYFICPRYVGDGLDLSGMFVRVNYRNAGGDEDGYLVEDVAVSGEYVTFSWRLWPKVTEYKGQIQFTVCADLPSTPSRKMPDWNTTIASGKVLEGLHPYDGEVEEETRDVVTQLRDMVEAQTVAVEATGAEKVQEVQESANAAQAGAVAAVQAQGASTLATIPEDYTTLANKANEHANAIKGHLSGEVVRADDVSPVEHCLGVKVKGKNLFDISKIQTMEADNQYAYISEVGANYIKIKTPDGYAGNGYCTVAMPLKEICPSLEVGKTYILTATTESNSTNMYLPGIKKSWIFGNPMVATKEMLNSAITFYGLSTLAGMGTGECAISNIQIEEGTVATEYAPYIAPASVTVTRCGKNLLPYPFAHGAGNFAGVSITAENGILTLNGTATKDTGFSLFSGNLRVKGTYALSGVTGGSGSTYYIQPAIDGTAMPGFTDGSKVYELDGHLTTLVLNILAGTTFDNLKIAPMLEMGNAATEYEPYNGATAMPSATGIVTGLPSAAPNMTLLADTPGVTINCTYNRDTNAVYAEILEKIAALAAATN